tara:strand:- start:87 stop:344 length:258 start_codon:yes stop_codon:yes gene_type:complete
MFEKKVTKLWQGKYTSIRDYDIKRAVKKGGLIIIHNNQQMILNINELKDLKPNPKIFQSKYKGSYQLIDITFKPNNENNQQNQLF